MKKYKSFKTITRCINNLWKYDKLFIVLAFIFTVSAVIFPILGVLLPRFLIEQLQAIDINFEKILEILIIFTLSISVFSFISEFILRIVDARVMLVRINLLTDIFEKWNNLDYHYTEDPDFINNNNDSFRAISGNEGYESIIKKLFTLSSKLLLSFIYGYIIFQLSYWIIIAILVSVIIGIINALIVKRYNYNQKDKLAKVRRKIQHYERVTQDFSYGKDIRLYNFYDNIDKEYNFEIKSYFSVFKKIKNKEYRLGLIDLFFILITDAVMYYILITKVLNGLAIAEFTMYLLASLALTTILKEIGNDLTYIIGEGQYMNDYYHFMDTEFNEIGEGLKQTLEDTLEVEFKNVSFKYPKTDKYIIKNLNLKISKGEKIAIVGINGAGKTTIVKLILRFFTPTEGEILVNGVDYKEYDKEEYQKMFSPVFQDINILAFTVRENITFGLSNDEDLIWECLDAVGLGNKIRKLEKGLETNLLKNIDEEGIVLSGGENQKLAIARALYKKSKMVILDEPTAALDALAEAEIYQNLNKLVGGKTSVYISHRLASTKFCDKIALFKESSLLEYGNHDELMGLKGEYYNMFVVQGKYYQEGDNDESI